MEIISAEMIYTALAVIFLLLLVFLAGRHCVLRYDTTIDKFIEFNNNIMVITNDEEIIKVNGAGLNFFGYSTLEAFKKDHKYIHKLFEEVALSDKDRFAIEPKWVTKIDSHREIKVKMNYQLNTNSRIEQYFYLRVSEIKSHKYLLTFSNITSLEKEKNDIQEEAEHDPLTRIYNRLKFNKIFNEMYYRADTFGEGFSVILMDIDHFKQINDNEGHTIGDRVLSELATLVRLELRKNDVFARWGGEEFIILTRFLSAKEAHQFSERLRKVVEQYRFSFVNRQVTCSFGITQFRKGDTQSDIFKRADDALYRAKDQGRNQVVLK